VAEVLISQWRLCDHSLGCCDEGSLHWKRGLDPVDRAVGFLLLVVHAQREGLVVVLVVGLSRRGFG
jgi:hypothetical protein